ncbi:MAG: FAD-dependent oxidoreductase [Pseudomonadota bacterium]
MSVDPTMPPSPPSQPATERATRCCIAGGGPAGMVLGLLLARAGVDVTVLEKHNDFLRDFRGDTVHPSTLQVLHELGLLDAFLQRPHDKVRQLHATVYGRDMVLADFAGLPPPCDFIALMPQWDFLAFIRDEAVRYPGFHLRMDAEATGLVQEGGAVVGVALTRGARAGRPLASELRADLVIAADGRHSTLRAAAGLPLRDLGSPIDVLWMRIPKAPGDPDTTGGHIEPGRFLVAINRGDYWQCALVIAKGGIADLQARGIETFRRAIEEVAPYFAGRLELALPDWDAVKLLSVRVDRLDTWWRPGLLCIGDAAHAMSPVGGVGINLAVQDAVATANILAAALADGRPAAGITPLLAEVQARRMWPAKVTQAVQVMLHKRLLAPIVGAQPGEVRDARPAPRKVPWPMRLLDDLPLLRGLPARAVGLGVRPEHVRSPKR